MRACASKRKFRVPPCASAVGRQNVIRRGEGTGTMRRAAPECEEEGRAAAECGSLHFCNGLRRRRSESARRAARAPSPAARPKGPCSTVRGVWGRGGCSTYTTRPARTSRKGSDPGAVIARHGRIPPPPLPPSRRRTRASMNGAPAQLTRPLAVPLARSQALSPSRSVIMLST